MTKPYTVYITTQDISKEKGYNLNACLKVDQSGDIEQTKAHFLDEIAMIIYSKILEITKDSAEAELVCTDDEFKNTIALMQLVQAVYVIENGDVLSVSDDTGLIDMDKLKSNKNALADFVANTLNSLPIKYAGLY